MALKREHLLAISAVLVFFLLWSLLSYTGFVPKIFLPAPTEVYRAFFLSLGSGLLNDFFVSLFRVSVGFGLSLILGVVFGVFCGRNAKLNAFLTQPLSFFRYAPIAALVPLLILWFGLTDLAVIMVIVIGVMPYFSLLVADCVENVERELVDSARTFGLNEMQVIKRVVLPRITPQVFDYARLGFASAWSFLILAEMVAAVSGMGHFLVVSQRFIQTDKVFAGVILVVAIGLFADLSFRFAYSFLFPWSEKAV